MGLRRQRRSGDGGRLSFRWGGLLAIALGAVLVAPPMAAAQQAAAAPGDAAAFTTEQLEQMLAPLALYPDDLLSQILMACTYPLEIVQADRWVKGQKDLKDEAAAKDLEAEPWDPSVKSLVAIPDVLALLSEKLDWTQQLGDAFIAQPKAVMDTVQALRARAKDAGKLESSKEQTVEVKQEGSTQTIVIVSAQPDVIYVPVYDSTVVYGYWPYPAYPPYPYYPPAYRVGTAIAVGFAWGYAWGHCNWHGGDIDIDINRNTNINHNIDRGRYADRAAGLKDGRGAWKHDPAHRDKVPYRDAGTAKRFGGETATQAKASREVFRGRSETLTTSAVRSEPLGNRAGGSGLDSTRPTASTRDSKLDTKSGMDLGSRSGTTKAGGKSGALDGLDRGGRDVKRDSVRGKSSRTQLSSRSGGSRGGRGGGGRGGGRGGR